MKIVSVVGARPQFVKAAPVSHALRRTHHEVLVHTGQHYDHLLSGVFFEQLSIPRPDYELAIGSLSPGAQVAAVMERLGPVLDTERPDWVLVYGDTNSTLGAALGAAKFPVPLAHVEAGVRSFNRAMSEEINRVTTDHLADLLFAPTESAVEQLRREGVAGRVHWVGDVMYDATLQYAAVAREQADVLARLDLEPGSYYLATVHRAENTDSPERLCAIAEGLARLDRPVVLPLHPRTRAAAERMGLTLQRGAVRVVDPVGFLDMLALEQAAACIVTDSGGVVREAFFLRIRCVTVRDQTEWPETVASGWNRLAPAEPDTIVRVVQDLLAQDLDPPPSVFGDGHAAEKIAQAFDELADA